MLQIKKTILTLVALLAVTTGAWAQKQITITQGFEDGMGDWTMNHCQNETGISNEYTVYEGSHNFRFYYTTNPPQYLISPELDENDGGTLSFYYGRYSPNYTESFKVGYSTTTSEPSAFTWGNEVTCTNVYSDGYLEYTYDFPAGTKYVSIACTSHDQFYLFIDDIKIEYTPAPASSGPEVAWDAAKKTGQFTMPAGNVELEPEYYPQAALAAVPTAINDVPATTDGAIVNAGTVANITGTTTAQGTVMYYVSTTALDDAALLTLDADAWTADVPTAESFTAAGQAYVYYYVRGNDSDTDEEIFSDGDILAANALTVTIAAEPTYAVTFAKGIDEPTEWTASPNTNVTKGETVTVTYTGSKKVIGVKAEKKAEAPHLVIEDKNNFFGIGNQKFYFTEGETWTEAMANHPENAAAGWVLNGRLRFKPDVYGNAVFVLRSDYKIIEEDIFNQPIDSSKTYSFSGTKPT